MTSAATDERQILDHIDGLFDAFRRKDRDAIRASHTDDWRGFQLRSRTLVRGIDAYMAATDEVLADLDLVGWEFLDTDVQVHGDLAIVYYLARDLLGHPDGSRRTVLIRAVDVYRREAGHWNQAGSHIVALPEDRA